MAFDGYAQVAGPGDVIDNPSIVWPEDRKLIRLGVVRLQHMAPEPAVTDRTTVFVPTNVPAGATPADPMLGVRKGADAISFQHRQ